MATSEDLLELAMETVRELRVDIDSGYRERAHLVAHLAALYPSVVAHGADPNAPGFAIVYVTLPGGEGQGSWHIAERDLDLFEHVHRDDTATWDGHSTAEKYRRLEAATKVQGQWQANLWVRTEDGVS